MKKHLLALLSCSVVLLAACGQREGPTVDELRRSLADTAEPLPNDKVVTHNDEEDFTTIDASSQGKVDDSVDDISSMAEGVAPRLSASFFNGTYTNNGRMAQFELLGTRGVRFYMLGTKDGSDAPCFIGGDSGEGTFLQMNGKTGRYVGPEHSLTVEFSGDSVNVQVLRSPCRFEGVLKKDHSYPAPSWDFEGGDGSDPGES